ncbi:MAG: hypothetical protein EBU72_12535, partial [Betaproteobacteria bacterium]|nr:hypothetical protein [Betaproteobacteria bacterium]
TQIKALTTAQIGYLSDNQVGALDATQITVVQMGALSAAQVAKLDMGDLSAEQIYGLKDAGVLGLTEDQIGALQSSQTTSADPGKGLKASHIKAMANNSDTTQLAWLAANTAVVGALTASQVAGLTADQKTTLGWVAPQA